MEPAFAIVGTSFTIIAIVEVELAQGKFEIVHWKIFVPIARPVIVVEGLFGVVIVPLPDNKVQIPDLGCAVKGPGHNIFAGRAKLG